MLPSESESLPSKEKLMGVFSCVKAVSSPATGGALTVVEILAVLEVPPSLSLTV